MNLPFAQAQFLQVFADYNQSLWPAQIVLNLLAVAAIVLSLRRSVLSDRIISILLTLLWLWMGIVYNFVFFAPINKAAWLFGGLFIVQAQRLVCRGVRKQEFSFRPRGTQGIIGGLLIVYALLIYPILGSVLGHSYPYAPTFGLPCQTTIFTLGMLLWLEQRPAWDVLVIPLLWSVIGFTAALRLDMREDFGLLAAGIVTAAFMLRRSAPAVKRVSESGVVAPHRQRLSGEKT